MAKSTGLSGITVGRSINESLKEVDAKKQARLVAERNNWVMNRVNRKGQRLASSVKVTNVADHVVRGADGKLHLKYAKTEVQWKQYKELKKIDTSVVRTDFKATVDGKKNERYGQQYTDKNLWTIKIYRTHDIHVGELRIFGESGHVPVTRELALIYTKLAAHGLFVTYAHENEGLVYRGKPVVVNDKEESMEDAIKRFETGLARSTSTIKRWLEEKAKVICGTSDAPDAAGLQCWQRMSKNAVKEALATPRNNIKNMYGYGLKRKEKDGHKLESSQEYVLSLASTKYPGNGPKRKGATCGAAPQPKQVTVYLDGDKAKHDKQTALEMKYPVRDAGGGGGHFRIGTESSVVKDLHKPEHRAAVEENIKAYVEHEMVLNFTQSQTMAASRKLQRVLGGMESDEPVQEITVLAEHESQGRTWKFCKVGRQWVILNHAEEEIACGKKGDITVKWGQIVRKGKMK